MMISQERLNTKIYLVNVFVFEKQPYGNYYQLTSLPTSVIFLSTEMALLSCRRFTCGSNSLKFVLDYLHEYLELACFHFASFLFIPHVFCFCKAGELLDRVFTNVVLVFSFPS